MEESSWCPSCQALTSHFDLVDCTTVCEGCGQVQETSSLVSSEFDGGGTRVEDVSGASAAWKLLDSSRAGRLVQQEAFKKQAVGRPQTVQRLIQIADLVNLPAAYRPDVETLIDQVLRGEWGQGRWLDILIAACVYIVIRQQRLPLTIADVASAVQSNPVEVGAMFRKVLQLLHLHLPEADPMAFIRSAVSRLLQGRQISKRGVLIEHAELLLFCARNASLTTGRRPLPLTAAILFQAAEGNQVKLTLEQVSQTLGAVTTTAGTRLRELRAALVAEGQKLPWGKEITESNIKQHLPMLLDLLSFSAGANSREQGLEMERGRLEQPTRRLTEGTMIRSGETGAVVAAKEAAIGAKSELSAGSQLINKKRRPGDVRATSAKREGTPENMGVGPLGSYLQSKKARSDAQDNDSPKAVSDVSGREQQAEHTHSLKQELSKRTEYGTACDVDRAFVSQLRSGVLRGAEQLETREPPVAGGQEAIDIRTGEDTAGLRKKGSVQSDVLARQAAESQIKSDQEHETKVPASSSKRKSITPSQVAYSRRVGLRSGTALAAEKREIESIESREEREKGQSMAPVDDIIDVEEPEYVTTPEPNQVELVKNEAKLQSPGESAAQKMSADTFTEASNKAIVPVGGILTLTKSLVPCASELQERSNAETEAVHGLLLNGLPPSFQAQGIERQRRAALIGEIKQRLPCIHSHLGVSAHNRPPNSAAPLAQLPKSPSKRPHRVLLAPKLKRKAAADPGWEAKTLEALLIRGADERLLLEGKYEQARLQLEAARPRDEACDEDVSEYIKSAAEVRLSHATRNFLASPKKL